MFGRKTYTREELDSASLAVDRQLAAYRELVAALDGAASNPQVAAALDALETLCFNNMTIVLDRYFVHRLRMVTGKDGNPINEVELLSDSLMNNGGVLRGNNVVKLVPDKTVTKIGIGEQIALDDAQFERLAGAFLADLEAKFVEG